MGLFGFGKKQETVREPARGAGPGARIKVLGGGCEKCHELEENTREALAELGLQEDVELVTDFGVIAAYGVMSTPALVVDEQVVSYGKVLKTKKITALLHKK